MDMFSNTKLFLKNLPGKKTSRKIVVIHVDDYGSIRMKDKAAQEALRKAGFPISSRYSKFETLASAEDLEMLFEVLTSVKDSNGHYACFTPFANVANPDFEKKNISSGFIPEREISAIYPLMISAFTGSS